MSNKRKQEREPNQETKKAKPSPPPSVSTGEAPLTQSASSKSKSKPKPNPNPKPKPKPKPKSSKPTAGGTPPVVTTPTIIGLNVMDTENAPILDGYVPEPDVTLRNHRGQELTLYSSQRRVGEVLLRKSRQMLNLSPEAPPSKINFFMIGPAQKEIRDQTIRDLDIVLEDALRDRNEHVVEVVRSMVGRVKNSAAIYSGNNGKKSKLSDEVKIFLTALENDPNGDHLHVLFHDEAHWGIENESNINTFLRLVLAKVKKHTKPNFLFVQVSATPQVLTLAASANVTIVNWKAPPSYRQIDDIRAINDCGQELMNQQKQEVRGEMLVRQYSEVLTAWINFLRCPDNALRSAAFRDARSSFPITYKALNKSVMEGITAEDAASMEHYSETGGRNKCLVVRMPNVKEARNLQNGVLAAFGGWTVFECLLYEGSTDATLSQRATGLPEDEESEPLPITEITTALDNVPSMIIVVDKLQMGSRIPQHTAIYDIRSRYVGSVENYIKGSECTFIQDAGRMAGHKSREARILMSLIADADLRKLGSGEYNDGEDSSEDDDENQVRPVKFKFQSVHALMNKNGTTSKNFDEKLYRELSPFTIILEALPQIGKTGAILSFLQKLYNARK